MNLPSFLWLWKLAASAMTLTLVAYLTLALTGGWLFNRRALGRARPHWLRPLHRWTGFVLVLLVLLLLGIGVIGTLGYYGQLGHSPHFAAGLTVVLLALVSAALATQIGRRPWGRSLHLLANSLLGLSLLVVTFTGWTVVQKYLP